MARKILTVGPTSLELRYAVVHTPTTDVVGLTYVKFSSSMDVMIVRGRWADSNGPYEIYEEPGSAEADFYTNVKRTCTKGHGQTELVFRIEAVLYDEGTGDAPMSRFDFAIEVQSLESYAVAYHGNGETGGSTGAQTKWYGEPLSLQPCGFTRTGWVFTGWNTAADGSGTSYAEGGTYTDDAALALYAQWKRNIDSVTVGEMPAIRVSSASATAEDDEGTYAYVAGTYTVSGAAAASIAVTATCSDASGGSHACTVASGASASKAESADSYGGSFVVRASGCETNTSYTFQVRVTAANKSAPQDAVWKSKGALLPTAFFALDMLGDSHYYNPTSDTSADPSKTYYARSGDGTAASPYAYTAVGSPSGNPSALGYYEASGARPGHGLSFGEPATAEGLNVAMDATFKGAVTLQGKGTGVVYSTSGVLGIARPLSTNDGGTGQSSLSTARAYLDNAPVATCNSNASAATKSASLPGFSRFAGAVIRVKFTYANTTAAALHLNVNSTGSAAIYHNGAATSATNPLKWLAGATLEFYWDGTYWVYTGHCTGSARQSTMTQFYFPSLTASTAPAESALPVLPCRVLLGDGSDWLYDGK